MYTSKEFVSFIRSMIGAPYWYGTCCYKASQSLLDAKKRQYPRQYQGYAATFQKAIVDKAVVCDCVGLIKGFFWSEGGERVYKYKRDGGNLALRYAYGINDYGANGIFNYCKKQGKYGKLDTLPEIPGIILWKSGHVGVYVGDGEVVQASWMNTGCYKTQLSNTKFTHWAMLPCLDYGEVTVSDDPKEDTTEKTITHDVKKGDTLWRIAQLYLGSGTKWPTIAKDNNISGTLIYPGMKLVIKGVK